MSALTADLWPYLLLVLVGFLPNEIWRVLGLVLGARARRGFRDRWCGCGRSRPRCWPRVIAKLTIFCARRARARAARDAARGGRVGFAGYFLIRRSVFAGVVVGEVVLIAARCCSGR